MSLAGIVDRLEWAKRRKGIQPHGWVDRRRRPDRIKRPNYRHHSPNPDRIERLILTGEMEDMVCVAKIVGVSRERVRQVMVTRGIDKTLLRRNSAIPIEWLCPRCGGIVQTTTRRIEIGAKTTPFCQKCASSGDSPGHKQADILCSVTNCDRKHRANGYCITHYDRRRSNQIPMDDPIRPRNAKFYGCTAVDCHEKEHYALGYCRKHHSQLRSLKKRGLSASNLPLGTYKRS